MKSEMRMLLLGSAIALAGCATSGDRAASGKATNDAARGTPEAILAERAMARWNLLIAGKAAEAYDYLSPGYRATKTREQYAIDLQNRPVKWKAVQHQSVECPPPGEFCDVTVEIEYEVKSHLPGVGALSSKSPVTERWIVLDGVWYLVPKEVARN